MKLLNISKIKKKAISIRRDVIEMVTKSRDGHIPSAQSMVEILAVLYYHILNIDPKDPTNENRDRFILSKGHGCASLYAILADLEFFPQNELEKYATVNGILGGHPEMQKIPGVEVSTGSLGHGFPMGVGMAISAKLKKQKHKIYCVLGDGECNEGTIWEAANIASHFKLDNLIAIVDHNKQQASGDVFEIMNPHSLTEKWRSFGWETVEVDGHNIEKLHTLLKSIPLNTGKPSAIIANTIKGKGVSFMENDRKWHTMIPNEDEYKAAMSELDEQEKKLKSKGNKK